MTSSLMDNPPSRVQRMTRSKIEIISSESAIKMQERYDRFANFVLSYGGSIAGCKFTTTLEMLTVHHGNHIIYVSSTQCPST